MPDKIMTFDVTDQGYRWVRAHLDGGIVTPRGKIVEIRAVSDRPRFADRVAVTRGASGDVSIEFGTGTRLAYKLITADTTLLVGDQGLFSDELSEALS